MPIPRRALSPLLILASVAAVVAGCGGSSHAKPDPKAAALVGAPLTQPFPERPITLRDYQGHTVSLSDFRGKAVLLTFLYTHCPDVCPLIAGHLHDALLKLGPAASKVQLVTVSADPRGDTPAAVARFLSLHGLTGQMKYLVGSRPTLLPVWKEWDVAANPDPNSNAVAHSALVFGITGSGIVTAIYPANFKPSDIVHDVPILASR